MAAGCICIAVLTGLLGTRTLVLSAPTDRIGVDMTGSGCFDNSERPLPDSKIYSLYANYNPQVKPAVDSCDVSIRATETNRQLLYVVERLVIFDCGVEILIFDNPQLTTTPKKRITCNDDKSTPITGQTTHGVIKVSMRKQSVQSAAFDFQISIRTNFGPDIDVDLKGSEFYEPPLQTGAIVGIAVAGTLLIIALVGIAIYCCLRNRNKHEAQASHRIQESPPSISEKMAVVEVEESMDQWRTYDPPPPPRRTERTTPSRTRPMKRQTTTRRSLTNRDRTAGRRVGSTTPHSTTRTRK